ncbi:MAG: AMP-binding protein [Deferrisomatales bacterium]|nr:AMP-binding protein [Deferrisomatales bacterium]
MDIGKTAKCLFIRTRLFPHRLLAGALKHNGQWQAFGDGTTYRELLDRCLRLAGHLRASGLGPGDRLLLDLPNGAAFIEARLAAILSGVTVVPIPPETSAERLGWLADSTGARFYLGPRATCLPGLPGITVSLLTGDQEEYRHCLARAQPLSRPPRLGADHLLSINFTSGTTGEPKGVMSTISGWGFSLYYALLENRVPLQPGEVFLHTIPLATAGSTLLLPAVLSGSKNLFIQDWDPDLAAQRVEAERVTRLFLTPTLLAQFMDAVRARGTDTASLKSVIYGTEDIPPARVRKALKILGPKLQQGYGMAEALPPVCLLHPSDHERGLRQNEDPSLLASAGRPTRAVTLRICDAEGHPLPTGTQGSIRLKGRTVSPGYWQRPDLTAATRANGYYISGDEGFLDAGGYLHVRGREGSVPSPWSRELRNRAESRDDVSLAWVVEARGAAILHVVPAQGRRLEENELRDSLDRAADGRKVHGVRVHREPPMTPSYKLDTRGEAR